MSAHNTEPKVDQARPILDSLIELVRGDPNNSRAGRYMDRQERVWLFLAHLTDRNHGNFDLSRATDINMGDFVLRASVIISTTIESMPNGDPKHPDRFDIYPGVSVEVFDPQEEPCHSKPVGNSVDNPVMIKVDMDGIVLPVMRPPLAINSLTSDIAQPWIDHLPDVIAAWEPIGEPPAQPSYS